MPEKETLERAAEDKAEGKSPSTQAGEFVREEIEHVREARHGAYTRSFMRQSPIVTRWRFFSTARLTASIIFIAPSLVAR
jgi:hypothetical protein